MKDVRLKAGKDELTITIDETDHIGRIIDTHKQWYEHAMLVDLVARLSKYSPGAILDVGAHIGNHSLYLSSRTNRHVYALEPYEPNRLLLEKNVAQNSLPITIYPIAAGNSLSTGTIIPPRSGNSGTAAISSDNTIQPDSDVNIVPLDRLDIPSIALLKIDTEDSASGAIRVTSILHGAKEILNKDTPLLCIEGDRQTIQRALPEGYQYVATYNRTPTHVFEHLNRST